MLEQRRRRDDRQVEVPVQEALCEGLEPKIALLDRRVAQLVPVRVLDPAEMGVDVPILRDLLDLRKDVVEVLGPLEEPEAPRVHVREVEDGEYALRVFHEREDLVETPDDLLAAARLDPGPPAGL